MQRYNNLQGISGVDAYELGDTWIKVRFHNGVTYLYDEATTGRQHIRRMKLFAQKGEGLSTYISQHVHDRYAAKLA